MDNAQYFDQPAVWSDSAHEYQVQVGKDVVQLIPADVVQVLDVGCGNGLITKELADGYQVVGVDQSAVALTESKVPVAQADAGHLPFADAAFDLVLTTDMLEHVSALDDVVRELVRVSRKYVLVTVPYAEDLSSKLAVCEQCESQFHINHHLRSFDVALIRQMENLIGPLIEMRMSGGVGKPPPDELAEVRHAAGCFMDWPGSKCPNCGSPGTAGLASDISRSMLNSLRSQAWAVRLQQQGVCEDRSEVMCLFAIDDATSKVFRPTPSMELAVVRKNLTAVQFDLKRSGEEFVAGAQYACQRLLPSADGSRENTYQVSFPVPLSTGDEITLTLEPPGQVSVFAIHGVLGEKIELSLQSALGRASQTYLIEQEIDCSQFGGLIELVMNAAVQPVHCELKSKIAAALDSDFVILEPGANIVSLQHEQRRFSWSMYCDSTIQYPDPMPVLVSLRDQYINPTKNLGGGALGFDSATHSLLPMLGVIDSLATRVEQVSRIANDVEGRRSELEEKIVQHDDENLIARADVQRWAAQVEEMSLMANKLEAQRSSLDEALLASQSSYDEAQQRLSKLEPLEAELASAIQNVQVLNDQANEFEAKRGMLEDLIQSKDKALMELEEAYNKLLSSSGRT